MRMPHSLQSSPNLHIRPAEQEDMQRVGDLLVAGFPTYTYPVTTPQEREEAERRRATKEHLANFAASSLRDRKGNAQYWTEYAAQTGHMVLVAELDGAGIVGYAASKQWQPGQLKLAELHDIQVAERFRLRGIGARLLNQLGEEHTKQENTATFACFIRWAPCRGFYRHVGAHILGPINSVKTAPANKDAIQFDTDIAAIVHDQNQLQNIPLEERSVLLRSEIMRHIGPDAEETQNRALGIVQELY